MIWVASSFKILIF